MKKIPKNENFKNQRKMCPHNIVRKLHAKFQEAGARGCRDMMYRRYRRKYGEKNRREKNYGEIPNTHPRSKNGHFQTVTEIKPN